MNAPAIFSACNPAAMVGWVVLLVAPRWRWTQRIAAAISIGLAVAYAAIIAVTWPGHRGGFSSLAAVSELFSDPRALLAGWVHYLSFDLLVGAWESRDAIERGISRWLVAPCLALTFLFGPAGFALYILIRSIRARSPGAPA